MQDPVAVTPSPYEAALCQTLIQILSRKVHDLAGIVAALNDGEVRAPGQSQWTEAVFCAEIQRLGAIPAHEALTVPPSVARVFSTKS
jgi:hypothetical protein